MKRIRQSNRRISSDIILATRLLLLLLQICHLQLITARTCAVPPGSEEHSCTDNPLQLTGAVNNRGEQTTRYSIGVDQRIDGTESEQKAIVEVLGRMEDYYVNEVLAHPEYASVRPRWYAMHASYCLVDHSYT